MKLSEELQWRGFVNQTTLKDIAKLDSTTFTFYLGMDPSADSLTIGNLAAIMMAKCFIRHGHTPFLLIGGATGMIGDPDGKSEERQLKPLDEIEKNKKTIIGQYKQTLAGEYFEVVDNYEWFKDMGYLAFLRDVGKHFSMTQLLQRDFIQARIGEGGRGISYAEFSYSLIQGYDFLHLYRTQGVTLQLAAADQWGNSLSGVELIRKLEGKEAHVFTCPLVINKTTGVKFGKTEAGAVWLSPAKTSIFDFYQFWLNVDDEGVEYYLKIYTLLDKHAIEKIMTEFKTDPAKRLAQKTLAFEVTKIVHGEDEAEKARQATDSLFTGKANDLMPTITIPAGKYDTVDILIKAKLATSNSEARRLLEQGGIKLNQQKVTTPTIHIKQGDVVQAGKRRFVKIG